jgi:tetratricopeptide (TPR) repeat protein
LNIRTSGDKISRVEGLKPRAHAVIWKRLVWLALFAVPGGPAAAYLECHQGAYSTICAEVGPPPGAAGGGGGSGPTPTPGIPQTEDEQMVALIDSAEALLARGKHDLALREIDEALELRPGDPDALAMRSRILASMGQAASPPRLPALGATATFDSPPAADPPPAWMPMLSDPAQPAPAAPPAPLPSPKPPVQIAAAPPPAETVPTSIVDARGQTVDLRLPIPEQMLNSPALGEWRKAMDAVTKRDWAVAAAWFKQGLNKDPANDALLRAADLADWTLDQRKQEESAKGALQLIDQAFAARDAGDFARQDAILAQIRNDPRYQDPSAQRWRDLVFAHLEARSLEGGPKPVAQMTEAEKTELIAQRVMGEFLAEDCQRFGNAALLEGRTADAKVAFQAAAAVAPHIPYYRRTAETLTGAQ